MPDLLLELFSEEIPARMQGAASEELARRVEAALDGARLTHAGVERFVTPRRLAVRVNGVAAEQPDLSVEKKGPKLGAPQGAIDGFCRSVGLDVSQLEQREIKGEMFYFAVQNQRGQKTLAALPSLLEAALRDFPWPKSMRWGDREMTWVRPLRRIVCLLDDAVVALRFGHVEASNITEGHRFLSPGEIALSHPGEYEAKLEAAHVIADATRRRAIIAAETARIAAVHGGQMRADEKLLDEVTGLVEWPVVFCGEFEAEYLTLPPEVLVLEMRHHQKYFAMQSPDGMLMNRFLLVANLPAANDGAAVIHGNQRVLRARLEDGRFYWDQDRKTPLGEWAGKLDGMLFHAKLGSMGEKVERMTALAAALAASVPGAEAATVERAASLAKADLVTGMVGEFPELQGVMGRYYATAQGEDAGVADAIRDHYKPAGAEDAVPTAPTAICVALADKLDALVGLFAAGEKPTGSKDPFALRRAALGIIRIILENGLRLPLRSVLNSALAGYAGRFDPHPTSPWKGEGKDTSSLSQGEDRGGGRSVGGAKALLDELLAFFADRLKVMLKEQGVRHDLIAAIFALGDEDDLVRLVARAKALQAFLDGEDGANLLTAYRRAANIVAKEEKKDGLRYDAERLTPALFEQPEETRLGGAIEAARHEVARAMAAEDDAAAMQALSKLRAPVDAFFEQVTVNAERTDLRINRLAMLSAIAELLNGVARFDKVEG